MIEMFGDYITNTQVSKNKTNFVYTRVSSNEVQRTDEREKYEKFV
jgi:hypothetical protein